MGLNLHSERKRIENKGIDHIIIRIKDAGALQERVFTYPQEYRPLQGFGAYMSSGCLENIMSCARGGDAKLEHIGILLGRHFRDSEQDIEWIEIVHIIDQPPGVVATPSRVVMGHEASTDISEMYYALSAMSEREGLEVVGWWHSHPNIPIFFSTTDKENQKNVYSKNYQVGIVVDPFSGRWGAYRGKDSEEFMITIVPRDRVIPGSTLHDYKISVFETKSP